MSQGGGSNLTQGEGQKCPINPSYESILLNPSMGILPCVHPTDPHLLSNCCMARPQRGIR